VTDSLYWVQANRLADDFQDTKEALAEPDGLLAAGGDLSPERLLNAYCRGIFPWFSDGQPILWWAPDPRSVLFPERLKISRSLAKTLRRQPFHVTFDTAFIDVMRGCAAPRRGEPGTWITDAMLDAYTSLHRAGFAHSIECWSAGHLVGGLYGVAIGCVFFGESMFSAATDASKVALANLVDRLLSWEYRLIDCQIHNAHLESLGAERIPRAEFNVLVHEHCAQAPHAEAWQHGVTA
jgi:leucyl/phenylalanyl-tRNA--protein transferase